ncbi:MAG: SusD/RagB family nutrient-binding outer membrane lipoprotein [Bacteroidales bacterium]
MKKIYKYILIAFIGIVLAGCTKDFDEINIDPDRADNVPPTNILSYSIRYSTQELFDAWNDLNEPSTFGGQITKIQYIDESRYKYRNSVVDNKWFYCYIVASNCKEIQRLCSIEGSENPNLSAVAKIWEVLIMQIVTDTWRDAPYSDGFKLADGITQPQYDTQETIYPALLTKLKEAADALGTGGDIGNGDILFNKDVTSWKRFCNSLRLRLAIRINKVDNTLAKATIEEILGDPTKYPIIQTNAQNAFFWWPGAKPYNEPWYDDSLTRDDHGVSDVMINQLKADNDPRLYYYAHPAKTDNEFRGFTIGASAVAANVNSLSRIGARFRDEKAGFTPFFRAAETWFDIAEAAFIGYTTGFTAKDAYERGVTLSLEENSAYAKTVKDNNGTTIFTFTGTTISDYLAGAGAYDGTHAKICLEKWKSLYKQGMEVWSLYRRTGIPTTNYVAPGRGTANAEYLNHLTPPLRYPYPINETSLNGSNSKASIDKIEDDFWGEPMWWDGKVTD